MSSTNKKKKGSTKVIYTFKVIRENKKDDITMKEYRLLEHAREWIKNEGDSQLIYKIEQWQGKTRLYGCIKTDDYMVDAWTTRTHIEKWQCSHNKWQVTDKAEFVQG